jgi:hypothetical protein
MSGLEPYKLVVKTIVKSKAKLFKFLPTKSFVLGGSFQISFRFENMSQETFPGADCSYKIEWPSRQIVEHRFPISPLKKNEVYNSPTLTTEALCDGFGLIYITGLSTVKDEQGRTRQVKFYSGKRVEDYIDIEYSVSSVNAKSWEEIYEFWALIIATISLLIIALEKIISLLNWLITK